MKHIYQMKRIVSLVCFVLSCLTVAATEVPSSEKIRLNDGWQYLKGDLGSIWEAVRPASPGSSESVPVWENVSLPHCFNAYDSVDPDVNYYQGPGWYRNTLKLANPYPGGRVLLEFEGAGQKTEVYVGMQKVGTHMGGYDAWSVDITDAVDDPDNVRLSVRCDNSRDTEMIPSDLSDFNLYGGLYRYVNLVYAPALSFDKVKISAKPAAVHQAKPAKGRKRARWDVSVDVSLYNPEDIPLEDGEAELSVSILDPQGTQVASDVIPVSGDTCAFGFGISDPRIWSTDNPELYTCVLTLRRDGVEYSASERFGLRSFEFLDHGPFMLNGERLLLRGSHRHEDHAGTGAAMTEDMMRTEMRMMKDMGVNFIRLAHYQQSEIILDLCDELGILVWEEIPWCRGGLGGEKYRAQACTMLSNMIEQHYNHPSVIIWGLGNENDWPGDFPEFDKTAVREFMSVLNDLAHEMDPSRRTAIRRCEFCKDIVDVYSPSIWAGWYRGVYTDYKRVSEDEMGKVSHFLHVEWGGDSHAGRHSEDIFENIKDVQGGGAADERAGDASLHGGKKRVSKDGNWSESYIVRLIDWHLKEQETMPWLTGAAYWPFKDFSTPVRPENPVPYVNQKGVIERDFTPKESYYVFQSYWTETPMIHIYGHSWPVRWGDAGDRKEVLVYSNCDRAELFVNGESQGVRVRDSQDFPAAGLRWNCEYRPGENELRVVGFKDGIVVEDSISQVYQTEKWGSEAVLKLSSRLLDDGNVEVSVRVEDEAGVLCLDSRRVVRFALAGDGRLLTNLGTSSGSSVVQVCNGVARIRVSGAASTAVSVSSEGLRTAILQL